MVKLATLAVTAAVALVAAFAPATQSTPQVTAQEEDGPTAILLNSAACFGLFGATFIGTCSNIAETGNLASTGHLLLAQIDSEGDDDDRVEPEELAGLAALGTNHIHQEDGSVMVILTVNDDDAIEFDTSKGKFTDIGLGVTAKRYICDAFGQGLAVDEDCDGDGIRGDGVVIAHLNSDGAALGEGVVEAWNYETGEQLMGITFVIVGEPDELGGGAFETTVNGGLPDVNGDGYAPDAGDCELPGDAAGFLAALNDPYKTVVIGRVTDDNGDNIGAAWIKWSVDDEDAAALAQPETPTLDLGSFGIGAPQVLCGLNGPASVKLTMELVNGPQGINLDPQAASEEMDIDMKILGVADAVALAVDPPTVTCDGIAGATVSATVTDEDGALVANNYRVRFDVSVLGTANPIVGLTADGIAKTTVTPLSGATSGVPVIVSVNEPTITTYSLADDDDDDNDGDGTTDEKGELAVDEAGITSPNPDFIQASVLVNCATGGAPAPAPSPGTGAPGGRPGGVISGPDTGTGGDLDGRGAMPAWPAAALLVGAMALVGARYALRRTE